MSGDIGALSVADENADPEAPQPESTEPESAEPESAEPESAESKSAEDDAAPKKKAATPRKRPASQAEAASKPQSAANGKAPRDTWTLFEVFVRPRRGLSHNHVGSIHAPDAEMALKNARDMYTRRQEGVSIWVIPSTEITATSPDEKDSYFEPAMDKIYRHPTFYDVPEGVQM